MQGASVDFFERQFRRQIAGHDYALNPFEIRALPYLEGEVLDLGCGLGNLALDAARHGARVTAFDASDCAIEDLARRAAAEGLAVDARACDLREWRPERSWDAVACIGLLMFFDPRAAHAGLTAIRDAVRSGGVAIVNVLVEGTTYLDMFGPAGHCLFACGELAGAFAGWNVLHEFRDRYPAPGDREKRFETVIVRRP